MQETPRDGVSEDQLRYARRVGSAILRLSPRTPTNSNCYPQALTAWWLLHRKRIPTTIYYGSEEHTSELQSQSKLVCRLQLEKKKRSRARDNCRQARPPSSAAHSCPASLRAPSTRTRPPAR